MHYHSHKNLILALDVRGKKIGYAVLDGPAELLDFGVSGSIIDGYQADRVEKLISKFQPKAVVMRKISKGSTRDNPSARAAISSIGSRIKQLGLPLASIDRLNSKKHFGARADLQSTILPYCSQGASPH